MSSRRSSEFVRQNDQVNSAAHNVNTQRQSRPKFKGGVSSQHEPMGRQPTQLHRHIQCPNPATLARPAAQLRPASVRSCSPSPWSVITASSRDRQDVRIFRLFERKTGFNRREAIDAGQLLLQEAVVSFEVCDDYAQQIIARPGHEIAFQHLRPFRNRLFETLERFDALALQFDRNEDADGRPTLLWSRTAT